MFARWDAQRDHADFLLRVNFSRFAIERGLPAGKVILAEAHRALVGDGDADGVVGDLLNLQVRPLANHIEAENGQPQRVGDVLLWLRRGVVADALAPYRVELIVTGRPPDVIRFLHLDLIQRGEVFPVDKGLVGVDQRQGGGQHKQQPGA